MKTKFLSIAVILCGALTAQASIANFPGFILPARYYDAGNGRFLSPDTVVPSPTDPQSLNRYAYVRNNPVILTDPSGYKWTLGDVWDKVVNLVVAVFSQPPQQPRSDNEQNRPSSRTGSDGFVPSASQPTSNLRAIIAVQQTPILLSGPSTVFTWAVADSLSDRILSSGDYAKLASNIYGHQASDKEKRALAVAFSLGASYNYRKIAGYQPKPFKGKGYAEKDTFTAGIDGVNNIGYAHMGPPGVFFDEGGSFSQFTNSIFGVNAVAGVHDRFQVSLQERNGVGWRENPVMNALGMPIAAAITYPALNWQPGWLFYDWQDQGW